jgi:hypothetical protein
MIQPTNRLPITHSSFPDFLAACRETLDRLVQVGVGWKGTRFDMYKRTVEEMAELSYPRSVNLENKDEREKDRFFREAASQFSQLNVSTALWEKQDQAVLASKLKDVVSGTAMPAKGKDWDPSRNALAELATGSLLERRGFLVTLTSAKEDLIARSPSLGEFAVEVKRPASEESIENNLKRLRSQLKQRCKRPGCMGLAVVAIDRIVSLAGSMARSQTEFEFRSTLDRTMEEQTVKLRALVQRRDLRLFPTTPFVAALLVGTVFVDDLGMPVQIGMLSMRSTASLDAMDQERVDRMQRQLSTF